MLTCPQRSPRAIFFLLSLRVLLLLRTRSGVLRVLRVFLFFVLSTIVVVNCRCFVVFCLVVVIRRAGGADRNEPRAHAVPTAPVNGDGPLRRRLLGYGDQRFLRLDGVRGARGQVI